MSHSTPGPKVLVVDDEPDIAELVRTVLEGEGFSTETAVSGFDGLRKLKENGFKLVTLDVFMPGMDGWEFLDRMREDDSFSGIKVVLFTILETKDAFERAQKMGISLIPKSYGHDALIRAVKEMAV